jgi:hypothetical protein
MPTGRKEQPKMELDTTTEFGARVARRLKEEEVI